MKTKETQYKANLYLEQIKYLSDEKNSIQDKFLSGINLPIAALGILIYYIESSSAPSVKSIYLILPFLYLFIPYNLLKFSIRMLSINGYIKHLEKQINVLIKEKLFLWNTELIDSSYFPWGFSIVSNLAQLPIHLVLVGFLVIRFAETIGQDTILKAYHPFFVFFLVFELITMIIMLIDVIYVQRTVIKKIETIIASEENEEKKRE